MSRGSPSLIALLGLLAVGGYQNRDKLADLMRGRAGGQGLTGTGGSAGSGGLMDQLGQMVGGGRDHSTGGMQSGGILGGLSEMVERFTGSHQRDKAQSWVSTGPNTPISPTELQDVLDEDTLTELTQKTGLSRSELLTRLADVLPEAVNQATPDGRLPSDDGARGTY